MLAANFSCHPHHFCRTFYLYSKRKLAKYSSFCFFICFLAVLFFFFWSYLAAWAYHLGHCFRVYRGVIRFLCHSFCSTAVSPPQEGKKKRNSSQECSLKPLPWERVPLPLAAFFFDSWRHSGKLVFCQSRMPPQMQGVLPRQTCFKTQGCFLTNVFFFICVVVCWIVRWVWWPCKCSFYTRGCGHASHIFNVWAV